MLTINICIIFFQQLPDSQSSENLASSGSLYLPNSGTSVESEVDDNNTLETEGIDFDDDSYLFVSWKSLVGLLSKCQVHGCSASVLPSNMEFSRNGWFSSFHM